MQVNALWYSETSIDTLLILNIRANRIRAQRARSRLFVNETADTLPHAAGLHKVSSILKGHHYVAMLATTITPWFGK